MVRTANLLNHYTGDSTYTKMAAQAMRYVGTLEIARTFPAAGVLLADYEFTHPPVHLTVVGRKDDPAAAKLFAAALRMPSDYKRIEWWDDREGPLPHAEVEYPKLDRAAAFVCSDRTCSKPIFAADEVKPKAEEMLAKNSEPAVSAPKP
jgi:uncharacterized protein YyaL (SSP411 family)